MVDTSVGDVGRHLVVVHLAVVTRLAFHQCKLIILVAFSFFQYLAALCAFCQLTTGV
jgi:hypothetical protein